MPKAGIQKDYTGVRFSRLVVKECLGKIKLPRRVYYWRSVCDCGGEVICPISELLQSSHPTKSCGCWRDDQRTKHGLSKTPEYQRQRSMKCRYDLSTETHQAMLAEQDNKCAVCEAPFTKAPMTDHDHACCAGSHTCGKCIRGLLCRQCNTALGLFKDNIQTLLNAVGYLRRFKHVNSATA
jgi:hypothetical protein